MLEEVERWVPLPVKDPDLSRWYEVSTLGRVRSLPRYTSIGRGKYRKYMGRILKTRVRPRGGQVEVAVHAGTEAMALTLRMIVGLAFHGTANVWFRDGNPLNCRADNLIPKSPRNSSGGV